MPNHRKATFMVSSMPKKAMKAGRKAVMGMARIGAATGLTKSWTHRKLAINSPRGIAIQAHQKNAWAIRHQLCRTLPRRLYSLHRRPKAAITPVGRGRANGGRMSE